MRWPSCKPLDGLYLLSSCLPLEGIFDLFIFFFSEPSTEGTCWNTNLKSSFFFYFFWYFYFFSSIFFCFFFKRFSFCFNIWHSLVKYIECEDIECAISSILMTLIQPMPQSRKKPQSTKSVMQMKSFSKMLTFLDGTTENNFICCSTFPKPHVVLWGWDLWQLKKLERLGSCARAHTWAFDIILEKINSKTNKQSKTTKPPN